MTATSARPGASDEATALPVHPRTGLTAVGIVGGKPVWPILGGSGDGDSGTPTGQAPAATQPPPATPPAPQTTGQAPTQQGTGQDITSLPDWAQKIITDTRSEAAKHRTEKQTAAQQAQAAAQQRDAVLKALGLTQEGKAAPPDPDALAAQVEQLRATAWDNAAQAAIVRVSTGAGADPDALLDSHAFLDSLKEFAEDDPNSVDFRTKMQAHVKKWVEQHPKLKTAPTGPARSGGDHPGGAGAPSTRPTSLSAAIKKQFGG